MADKKETLKPKERVKYKFGQHDIDLTNYIHNLGTNVKSYLNSKNWNEGLRQEFMNAYNRYLTGLQELLANNTNRFTTNDFGSIIDSTGALSNTDNDDIDPVGSEYYYDNKGNRITTDDFNLLGKRKLKKYNTFSANREVATYFNAIGDALKGMETPLEKAQDAFDLSKHGFLANWTTTNNPAGGDFNLDPYLEKDAIDETTGKRGTTNRAAYLKELIENHINNIGEYDFSSSPFKNRDTYISRLREAALSLENGYNSEDVIALNRAGIGNEFLSKFFSTGATTEGLKTEALQAAEYIKQQLQLEEDLKTIDQANRMRAMSELGQYIKDNPFKSKYLGFLDGGDYNTELVLLDIEENYSHIEGDDNKVKAWINFGLLLKDLKDPVIEGSDPLRVYDWEATEKMAILRKNLAKKLKFAAELGYMKTYGNNEYVIPGSEDYNNYSVITYNPNTGEYKDQSVILNEQLRDKMAYDWYEKNKTVQSNKNGGTLSYLLEGGFMKRAREARQLKKLQEQPLLKVLLELEDNRSKEEKEASQRKLSDGLSGTDWARLAAIGMDLTSAISSFVPGVGTAFSGLTGIGSTLTTFGADIAEDGFQWSDLGNAGVGLGMDIVGMIPGFGTAGKASKIGKLLVKFAPYVLGALQAQNALSESSRKSWKKIIDGSFKDLTVDDLRNLASGITAFTSLSNLAGIRLKNSAMKSATKTGDLLISDKTGEMLRITPEKLEEIKNAQSLKDANKILQSIPGYEGKELASNFKQGFFAPVKRMFDNDPKVADHYDWDKLRGTVFDRKGWLPSDTNIFQSARSSNLGNIELHLKNPYSSLLDRPKKPNKNNTTKQNENNTTKQLPRFDELRQLSSQTGKLTPQEINLINRLRAKQKLPALSQLEIDSLNARRAYRGELNALIDKTFPYVFPTHSWSKKLRLSGIADNARYVLRRKIQEEVRAALKELAEANLNTPKEKQALANQIADQRVELAVNRNADNVRVQQLRELAALTLSKLVPLIPKAPLRGKAYINKEKFYDKLFSDDKYYPIRVITQPLKLLLVPKIPRKPSQVLHNSRLKLYDELFGIEPTITESAKGLVGGQPIPKTTKGLARAQRKQEAANQKSALEYVDKAKRLSKEKEIIKKINWELTKRELPHKQSSKKKKTSRDDKRTIKREDGGTLDLVRVRKFKYAGKFATLTDPTVASVMKPFQESSNNKSFLSNINPTIAYGLTRAMYADIMNRRITDLAKKSVVPLLKDPFEVHRYTRSDLDAEMQGERNYANLRRLASRPITSDGSLQTATLLLAELLGQEARTAGKEKSNLVRRLYDELAWLLNKENAANRHEKEMSNMAQLWNADKTKNAFEQAYLNKETTNRSILNQLLEYDAKVKLNENKALEDHFAKSDIHNAIIYAPNNYGANLTPNELTVWNKVLSGTEPSSLTSPGEFNSYKLALLKVSRAENDQLRKYYNISDTRWSRKTSSAPRTPWTPTMSEAISAKNGAKIAVAGIKAKTADAERFLKQIKEYLDRNEKAIDRLSKSLLGLIKASTIK